MADYFDHIVVRKLTFRDGAELAAPPSTGTVKGMMTLPAGVEQKITAQPAAPTTTTGSAGATYTSAEQAIINNLISQVNALQTALKNAGHLK